MLLIEHEGVIFSLILALATACVLASAIGLSIARQLSMITLVDVHILVPTVVSVALVGVYALHNSVGDVVLAMVFGVIGYLMIRYDYPRITLVIALVLGELAERSFFQSMIMSDQDATIFLTRGISAGLILITLLILFTPAVRLALSRRRAATPRDRQAEPATDSAWSPQVLAVPLVLLALSVVFLVWAYSYDPRSRMVPVLSGWILVGLTALDLVAATGTRAGRTVAAFFAGKMVTAGPATDAAGPYRRIVVAAGWIAGFVAAVLLFGFLPVIPVYVALFVILQGRLKAWQGLAAAAATTAFTGIVFEWLMQYSIYRGFLFE